MKPQPEIIELDEQELQAKLDQIEAALGAEMARPLRQLLAGYITVLGLLREKNISIQRLRKIIFGSSTERSSEIMPPEDNSSEQGTDTADDAPAAEQGSDASDDGQTPSGNDEEPASSGSTNGKRKKRRPGHGRNPAEAYTGCKQVVVTHSWLHPGDSCPRCAQGSVYRQRQWSAVVRLKGQAPVGGTVYQRERLRCHLCGCLYTAELPEQAGPNKYDPSVASIIATLRYGEGLPWNRIQRIQKSAGVPLPASTQWERVRDAIRGGIRAAYEHLRELAAQGELVHSDDTSMRVQALTEKLNRQEPLREDAPERRGVFTTGILSRAEGRPWIALFFTGPRHAGENLRSLLAKRREELPPPIQMCDPLSRNMPEDLNVILANCLTHGRRKFVEVIEAFPSEVKYLIECLKRVYQIDAEARKQQLPPDERLRLHQQHSGPVMDQLHRWLKQQLDQRKVEPNSSLGGAIRYMLKHWEKMTLFLRVAGAPLDNNICEQAMKMAIRHRKNSLFYKTMRGAEVGDLYMSLIHTCYFCGADPCDYLTQLQRNGDRVIAAPGDWMPWNYRQQLDAEGTHSDSSRGPPAATEAFSTQPPNR